MEITNKAVKELTPYAKNAKKHDKRQIENVAKSIEEYGFVQPVVIDRNGVIIIGHCRVLAAKQLGMKEVPCVCVDDLTPGQVNALRLVDNKSNESEWDMGLLAAELDDVDLSMFEFEWGAKEATIGMLTAFQASFEICLYSRLFPCSMHAEVTGKSEKKFGGH